MSVWLKAYGDPNMTEHIPGSLCGSPSNVLTAKKKTIRKSGAISSWSAAILQSTAGMLHIHEQSAHATLHLEIELLAACPHMHEISHCKSSAMPLHCLVGIRNVTYVSGTRARSSAGCIFTTH